MKHALEVFTENDLFKAFCEKDHWRRIGTILDRQKWHNTPFASLAEYPDDPKRKYVKLPPPAEPILATAVRLHRADVVRFLLENKKIDVNVSPVPGESLHCLDILWYDGRELYEYEIKYLVFPFVYRSDLKYPLLSALLIRHNLLGLLFEAAFYEKVATFDVPLQGINDCIEYYVMTHANICANVMADILSIFSVKCYKPKTNMIQRFITCKNNALNELAYEGSLDCFECDEVEYDRRWGFDILRLKPTLSTIALSQHTRASKSPLCYMAKLSLELLLKVVEFVRRLLKEELKEIEVGSYAERCSIHRENYPDDRESSSDEENDN